MTAKKKEAGTSLLPFTITEGVTVNVIAHDEHVFLMTTKDVANGYGTTEYAIRQTKSTNPNDFIEGKHYRKGVSIAHTLSNSQPHQVFWTKRGIVRLGFFIKSERAKLFRDWAEELIINLERSPKLLPSPRKHNRLTQERIVDILADVARIDDRELRLSIVAKIMGGTVR